MRQTRRRLPPSPLREILTVTPPLYDHRDRNGRESRRKSAKIDKTTAGRRTPDARLRRPDAARRTPAGAWKARGQPPVGHDDARRPAWGPPGHRPGIARRAPHADPLPLRATPRQGRWPAAASAAVSTQGGRRRVLLGQVRCTVVPTGRRERSRPQAIASRARYKGSLLQMANTLISLPLLGVSQYG
jgi:hypothetical protein